MINIKTLSLLMGLHIYPYIRIIFSSICVKESQLLNNLIELDETDGIKNWFFLYLNTEHSYLCDKSIVDITFD